LQRKRTVVQLTESGLRIQWGNPWGFESPLSHYQVAVE
jgi:hypothetical protein